MSENNIEKEILSFIGSIIKKEQIDLIVCMERKATAIMRALIEEIDEPLQWEWNKVLSSIAIHQFDWSSFPGTKVFLFDELVHHGRGQVKSKLNLENAFKKANRDDIEIITGGFVVWEHCKNMPDYAYHGSVDAKTYEKKREEIVIMLQDYGSLLLDTEHVELSIRLQCGIGDLFDALARDAENGYTKSFISGAQRINLTINQPDIIDQEILDKYLISGSNTNNAVCKLRVVEKNHEKFSILPIFYPNIYCKFDSNWIDNLPDFMDKSYLTQASHDVLFYHVSLLASIELLRGVVSVLNDLIKDGLIVLESPQDKLKHLISMFPRINIKLLGEYILGLVSSSQKSKCLRGKHTSKTTNVDEKKLLLLCERVMKRMVVKYVTSPNGISWNELMQIAEVENRKRNIGLDPNSYSTIVDRLIDNSLIITGIDDLIVSNEDRYVIRTFKSEGEVVSDKIRKQLMIRNPECILLT